MTKPVSGREMRRAREEGIVITLSSGVSVAIRPVPMDLLLLSGEIPDSLSGIAAASVMEPGSEIPADKSNVDAITKYVALLNLVVRLTLVNPRISDNPQADNECTLEDFSEVERGEIFTLSRMPTEQLRRFRDQQIADVAALSEVQDVQPETEWPTTD